MSVKFSIESNLPEIRKQLEAKVQRLIDSDKLFREAALNTLTLISDRVQQRGENSEGQKMITKSKKKTGSYDFYYAKKRDEKGLQTDHIDLTFNEDMFNDFIAMPEGETGYVVGFRGELSSDKADWNERKFGTIFELSEKEKELVYGIIKKRANAILNK